MEEEEALTLPLGLPRPPRMVGQPVMKVSPGLALGKGQFKRFATSVLPRGPPNGGWRRC